MLGNLETDAEEVHGARCEGLDRVPVPRRPRRRAHGQAQRHVSARALYRRGCTGAPHPGEPPATVARGVVRTARSHDLTRGLKIGALAFGVLLAGVIALGWLIRSEIQVNSHLSDELRELRKQLADKTANDRFKLQEACANRAESIFHQSGYGQIGLQSDGKSTVVYQNHYNDNLKKCFMTIETTTLDENHTTIRFLMDALEQREYAEYTWMSAKDKKYWEVPPIICWLWSSLDDKTPCHSEEEYNTFVARYME
jgi:hypothetical protein